MLDGILNYMKVGNLVIRKSFKLMPPGVTKFDFGWGSAPDPLAGFKGPYF